MATTTITPKAGFCIKTLVVAESLYSPPLAQSSDTNVLEPNTPNAPLHIPANFKVFINIAYDKAIPAPPNSSESDISKAMEGKQSSYYVPIVLSDGRSDTDKAGKPSLVFDAVFHPSVKTRILSSEDYKLFIIELALQSLEDKTRFTLSRRIGTPNIASKGKLQPRAVRIPAASQKTEPAAKKPLIEEVSLSSAPTWSGSGTTLTPPKGILKTTTQSMAASVASGKPLSWSWSKSDDGRIRIKVSVPSLSSSAISQSTLDLEPRRFILSITNTPTLDINFGLSDAEIVASAKVEASFSVTGSNGNSQAAGSEAERVQSTLMLKRQRELDVDNALAEWRIEDNVLEITA